MRRRTRNSWEGVSGIDYVVQEEGVVPFLIPKLRTIDCGGQHQQPCTCIGSTAQAAGFQSRDFLHGPPKRCLCILHIPVSDKTAPLF